MQIHLEGNQLTFCVGEERGMVVNWMNDENIYILRQKILFYLTWPWRWMRARGNFNAARISQEQENEWLLILNQVLDRFNKAFELLTWTFNFSKYEARNVK